MRDQFLAGTFYVSCKLELRSDQTFVRDSCVMCVVKKGEFGPLLIILNFYNREITSEFVIFDSEN